MLLLLSENMAWRWTFFFGECHGKKTFCMCGQFAINCSAAWSSVFVQKKHIGPRVSLYHWRGSGGRTLIQTYFELSGQIWLLFWQNRTHRSRLWQVAIMLACSLRVAASVLYRTPDAIKRSDLFLISFNTKSACALCFLLVIWPKSRCVRMRMHTICQIKIER